MPSTHAIITRARRIRRNLLRQWSDGRLAGACGLASVLLATQLGDLTSLRASPGHVWNEFSDALRGPLIVDITATQFWDAEGKPPYGVLVTRNPIDCHQNVEYVGVEALLFLEEEAWYKEPPDSASEDAYAARAWQRCMTHWLPRIEQTTCGK